MRSFFSAIRTALLAFACVLAGNLLAGCSKAARWDNASANADSDRASYTAIVTVKQQADGTVFFQLDEERRLYPENYKHAYKGLQRIICGLEERGKDRCYIQWMEFLEQPVVSWGVEFDEPSQGDGDMPGGGYVPPETYPQDGLDILEDWMTSVEDGFLTLHYSTWWGDGSVPHRFGLVPGTNPQDPYELLLWHDANGDAALEKADALICFDINGLPSTEGDYVNLRLKWTGCDGESASKVFRFRSRTL